MIIWRFVIKFGQLHHANKFQQHIVNTQYALLDVCVNVCVCPQMTLPWGSLSSLKLDCRSQSDDGPIMWVRPGEQMVPTADMPKSPFKRRRYDVSCTGNTVLSTHLCCRCYEENNNSSDCDLCVSVPVRPPTISCRSMNEIKNLHYLPRASEPREVLFEDRTKAHADHVGQSFDWQSTAAVGVLKAVHFGEWWVSFDLLQRVLYRIVQSFRESFIFWWPGRET